jgi:hypothetical protein
MLRLPRITWQGKNIAANTGMAGSKEYHLE